VDAGRFARVARVAAQRWGPVWLARCSRVGARLWGVYGAPIHAHIRTYAQRYVGKYVADRTGAWSGDWSGRLSRALRAPVVFDPGASLLLAPLALGLGAAAYISLEVEPVAWLAPLLAFVVGAGALVLRRRGARPAAWASVALAGLVALGFALTDRRTDAVAAPRVADSRAAAEISGWVDRVDASSTGRIRYSIRVASFDRSRAGEPTGEPLPVRVRVSGAARAARPGDRVRVRAVLQPPRAPSMPGAYDFARSAYFQQLGGVGYVVGPMEPAPEVEIRGFARAEAWLATVRGVLAERLAAAGGGDAGGVLAALVTGDRSRVTPQIAETLRVAGLGHILAISGLHLALVGGGAFFIFAWSFAAIEPLARRLNPRKLAAVGALTVSLSYLIISGGATSTQRAFVMAAVAFGAILADRRALTQRGVALAALIILLTRPESALTPGFQMSFAAAVALIAANDAQRRAKRARGPTPREPGALGSLKRFAGGLTITSLIAGTATAPFAAFHFNRIAVLGYGANFVAMPIFTLAVMPFAALAGVLAPFGLEAAPAWMSARAMELVIAIAARTEATPGALAPAASAPGAALALTAVAFVMAAVVMRGRWRAALPLALLASVAWKSAPSPGLWLGDNGGWVARVDTDEGLAWAGELGRGERYGAEQFMRRGGALAADASVLRDRGAWPDGFACDVTGCSGVIDGVRIAVVERWAGLADDCQRADVVLTPAWPPARVRARCAGVLLIPRRGRRDGGAVLHFADGVARLHAAGGSTRPWRRGAS